jgi:hypothetical protein
MRFLAVLAIVLPAIAVSAVSPARGASNLAAACPRQSVPAKSGPTLAAQTAFSSDFARIRQYLYQPTLANQLKMYSRVDASLFQYYSYQVGVLGASKGKVKGGFTLRFVPGSQCFASATELLSFRVNISAHFTSTNHKRLTFARLASVQMKTPKIFRYVDPVTR